MSELKKGNRRADMYAVTYNPVKREEGVRLSLLTKNKMVIGGNKQTDLHLSPERARALAMKLLEVIGDMAEEPEEKMVMVGVDL